MSNEEIILWAVVISVPVNAVARIFFWAMVRSIFNMKVKS